MALHLRHTWFGRCIDMANYWLEQESLFEQSESGSDKAAERYSVLRQVLIEPGRFATYPVGTENPNHD